MPARIQCSSGKDPAIAAAFSCSGYGCVSCVKPEYARAGCWPPNDEMGYIGVVYMPGIEVSPGCGRLSSPGLGMIPVWRCMARGDGVSARLQDIGLPVGLSLLSPGDTSRVPRCGSSARRASILKFFDFSIATLLGCLELQENTWIAVFYAQIHAF